MKSKSFKYFMWLMIILVFAVALYAYFKLPADGRYPVHWNIKGVPDRYGSKTEVVLLGPILVVAIYVMAIFLPRIDPKKFNYNKFYREYNLLIGIIMFFMASIYIIAILAAFGISIKIELWVPGMVGILFIIIGNYLSRVKQNWFVGIKTPWTLSNDKVWYKTHRFSGKVFVILGALMILEGITGFIQNSVVLVALILVIALSPIVYSYFIYKRIEKDT